MTGYNRLLGLHLDDVKKILEEDKVNFTITKIQGRKDKDKLVIPRVIKISENEEGIELTVTNFSDSLK